MNKDTEWTKRLASSASQGPMSLHSRMVIQGPQSGKEPHPRASSAQSPHHLFRWEIRGAPVCVGEHRVCADPGGRRLSAGGHLQKVAFSAYKENHKPGLRKCTESPRRTSPKLELTKADGLLLLRFI